MPCQLRERRGRTTERDVQQLDERVLLNGRQLFHAAPLGRAASSADRMSCLSNGLLTKAAAPASRTRSCDDVWMSAVTTITFTRGSNSRSFVRTSRPYL